MHGLDKHKIQNSDLLHVGREELVKLGIQGVSAELMSASVLKMGDQYTRGCYFIL